MKIWTSLEVDGRAGKILNPIRREAEKRINLQLEKMNFYSKEYQDWTWIHIAICLSPKLDPGYSEVVKRHIKDRSLEFRLRIDYDLLVKAHNIERIKLYFDSLRRCLSHEKIHTWGFSDKDNEKLLAILISVENQLSE